MIDLSPSLAPVITVFLDLNFQNTNFFMLKVQRDLLENDNERPGKLVQPIQLSCIKGVVQKWYEVSEICPNIAGLSYKYNEINNNSLRISFYDLHWWHLNRPNSLKAADSF